MVMKRLKLCLRWMIFARLSAYVDMLTKIFISSVKAKLLNRCLLAWESKAGVQISNGGVSAQH